MNCYRFSVGNQTFLSADFYVLLVFMYPLHFFIKCLHLMFNIFMFCVIIFILHLHLHF